jgi:hypothetical protein
MRRVVRTSPLRAVALSAFAGLCLAGCGVGRSSAPVAERFVGCPLLGPTWPLPVSGGSIAAFSIEDGTCEGGLREMKSLVAALHADRGAAGRRLAVSGWTCVSYDGNQATCLRGGATLYGQYGLLRRRR